MALILCPECGKEISDKVKACPHCGYPMSEDASLVETDTVVTPILEINSTQRKWKLFIPVILLIVIGCIAGSVIYYQTVLKPRNLYNDAVELLENKKYDDAEKIFKQIPNYKDVAMFQKEIKYQNAIILFENKKYDDAEKIFNEIPDYKDVVTLQMDMIYQNAMELLDQGKYEDANRIFNEIPDYKDVKTIQEQMKYESKAFQCITELNQILKNPDSLQVHEVSFYNNKEPVCCMSIGAENGFGGNTLSYVVFMDLYNNNEYVYTGSIKSLDVGDLDLYDKNYISDMKTWQIITYCREHCDEDGHVNMDRIDKLLDNGLYTTVNK